MNKQNFRDYFSIMFLFAGFFAGFISLIIAIFGFQGHSEINHFVLFLPISAVLSFLFCWVLQEDKK